MNHTHAAQTLGLRAAQKFSKRIARGLAAQAVQIKFRLNAPLAAA